ncbi:LegC family aminotransferase [Candidatus Pelagibacter sp. HIMB1495]|uniref:LegC family aminotransferase n=1 Tax=unclassified Candidatus Pelagibacter TaxID=2647897 RepID=UPI003F86B52E
MNKKILDDFIAEVKKLYREGAIPLHRPVFEGNEKKYLSECIDTNFVSSVGKKVLEFEKKVINFTGAKYAVATVNGTNALHIGLKLSGVKYNDEVITQSLTFVATCNAISYLGANPIFLDVDKDTMGLSPFALDSFLKKNAKIINNKTYNNKTGKRISACVPMHTFGFPCRIKEIKKICNKWKINLVEDAAESLGSYVKNKHTGTFSLIASISFNGNKIITTGGGGMLITNNYKIAKKAKHLTTTAKVPHLYEYIHDEIGFNFRMPNLNAALGCAQIENLNKFLLNKKKLSLHWRKFFEKRNVKFVVPIKDSEANYWLNAIVFKSKKERDYFLINTNKRGVMTRPIWRLMSQLKMFKNCQNDGLKNSLWLYDRVVNIPSSVSRKII